MHICMYTKYIYIYVYPVCILCSVSSTIACISMLCLNVSGAIGCCLDRRECTWACLAFNWELSPKALPSVLQAGNHGYKWDKICSTCHIAFWFIVSETLDWSPQLLCTIIYIELTDRNLWQGVASVSIWSIHFANLNVSLGTWRISCPSCNIKVLRVELFSQQVFLK